MRASLVKIGSAANDAKFQLEATTERLDLLCSVHVELGPAGDPRRDGFFKRSPKPGVSVEALTALDYAAMLSV